MVQRYLIKNQLEGNSLRTHFRHPFETEEKIMRLKEFGLAVVAAIAFTAFGASSAAATTLEVGGVAKNSSVSIQASLKSGTKTVFKDTFGTVSTECSESSLGGSTSSPFTGHTVTAVTSNLQYLLCTRFITIHKAGIVHLTFISGTSATVTWSQSEWTVGSPFGTLNCKTGEGTDVGSLTGVKTGNATMDINATISCSGISSKWEGIYTVTSPSGLGVTS
jgi:hypothetical protein